MMRLCLLLIILALGAGNAAAQDIRVGVSPDYPPLAYRENGQLVGIEPDNARAVGKILGRQVKLVPMPFGELLPALERGEVDTVMSGLTMTAARSERVAFVEPYLEVGQMAIMHRDQVARFAQPWSIYREGVRIGVEPGTTGADFAERELPDAVLSDFDNPDQAFAALRAGRIDLFVHDAPTSWRLANGTGSEDLISQYSPLTNEQLAWAVSKDNPALLGDMNKALALMRANGTLSYILNRWIPVQVQVE